VGDERLTAILADIWSFGQRPDWVAFQLVVAAAEYYARGRPGRAVPVMAGVCIADKPGSSSVECGCRSCIAPGSHGSGDELGVHRGCDAWLRSGKRVLRGA
jgi:hypothetical protein